MSRTWRADTFLNSVAQQIVMGKASFMSMLRFSEVFKHGFEKNCNPMENNPTSAQAITDLASSNHRYDSIQKPFGRGCIFWNALVVTVQQIFDERGPRDPAGARALHFLEFINEEVMLTFAMMAVAEEQMLALVRFFDGPDATNI